MARNRSVFCVGDNSFGQCAVPRDLGPVTSLSAGDTHTCAVNTSGVVRCWGSSVDPNQSQVPSGLGKILSVSAGKFHTCAVLEGNRTTTCWGSPSTGYSSPASAVAPHVPPSMRAVAVTSVVAGANTTCAVATNGTVYCWLLQWSLMANDTSTPFGPRTAMKQVDVSTVDRVCGLTNSGLMRCWFGGFADGLQTRSVAAVYYVVGQIQAISLGGKTACALSTTGALSCFDVSVNGVPPAKVAVHGELAAAGAALAVSSGGEQTCVIVPKCEWSPTAVSDTLLSSSMGLLLDPGLESSHHPIPVSPTRAHFAATILPWPQRCRASLEPGASTGVERAPPGPGLLELQLQWMAHPMACQLAGHAQPATQR